MVSRGGRSIESCVSSSFFFLTTPLSCSSFPSPFLCPLLIPLFSLFRPLFLSPYTSSVCLSGLPFSSFSSYLKTPSQTNTRFYLPLYLFTYLFIYRYLLNDPLCHRLEEDMICPLGLDMRWHITHSPVCQKWRDDSTGFSEEGGSP